MKSSVDGYSLSGRKKKWEIVMLAFISIHNVFEDAGNTDSMRLILFILLIVAILLIVIGFVVALYTFFSYLRERSNRIDTMHRRR